MIIAAAAEAANDGLGRSSDIETIESQIKSPRPKSTIIKECLASIRTILEGAAGSMIAALLVQQIMAQLK